jgi:hypothetical protein
MERKLHAACGMHTWTLVANHRVVDDTCRGCSALERYEALRRSKTYGIRRPCWYTAWTCLLLGFFLLAAAIVWVLFLPDKLL